MEWATSNSDLKISFNKKIASRSNLLCRTNMQNCTLYDSLVKVVHFLKSTLFLPKYKANNDFCDNYNTDYMNC